MSCRNRFVCTGKKARRGATMALLAILMPVMLAVAAFAINVVYMEMTRTELQISTDIATRAAGRTLAVTDDEAQAIAAAHLLLSQNSYANQFLQPSEVDIQFGVSTRSSEDARYQFGSGSPPNAVSVMTNGTNTVPMLFPTMGVSVPFRPIKRSICTQVELDFVLVLDRSGSMAYSANETADPFAPPASAPFGWEFGNPIPPNSRWLDLVGAVDGFFSVLDESAHLEHVALASYASESSRDLVPSLDYEAVRSQLDSYSAAFYGGATNTGDGIRDGLALIGQQTTSRPWATRVMILMSDGLANTGPDPIFEANAAAQNGVVIHTVSFSDEADTTLMAQIATIGAGDHYHATNASQLEQAFENIARDVPTILTE